MLSYLYAQTTRILKVKETPVMLVLYDTRSARSPRSSTASVHTSYRYARSSGGSTPAGPSRGVCSAEGLSPPVLWLCLSVCLAALLCALVAECGVPSVKSPRASDWHGVRAHAGGRRGCVRKGLLQRSPGQKGARGVGRGSGRLGVGWRCIAERGGTDSWNRRRK